MYKDYLEKANKVLADEFGIGIGTYTYKQIDKNGVISALVLLEVLNELKELNKKFDEYIKTNDVKGAKNTKKTPKKD